MLMANNSVNGEVETRFSILCVGQNLRNLELLADFLSRLNYRPYCISDVEAEDNPPIKEGAYQLALIDITGYDQSIWRFCERIRSKNIRLLVVSARQTASLTEESMKFGASGVLIKPLVMKELATLIHTFVNENNE
ncbi:MAG: response regulator [Bacilli bacterium]|nr:response regulator [Bacilli bacterium]